MLLIEGLQDSSLFDHPVTGFEVIETHISWVLLTGQYVYKIKKPVNFGFLDFSTLEKRHFYCREELRLNRRMAPGLYLDVVAICGSRERPELTGPGPAIEYAVKMRQFPQSAQFDRLLASHGLDKMTMDDLAVRVANFHLSSEPVEKESCFGDLQHVRQVVLENYEHIRRTIDNPVSMVLLDRLEKWSSNQLQELSDLIGQRKQQGFVRECHGDMHLRNIAMWHNDIIIFDCIEFNANLYQIDVVSDISFLLMDLEVRHQEVLARRFLNRYLEITGDYEGLRLLRFYKVYRALVRAKVDALRTDQEEYGSREYDLTFENFQHYLELADSYICSTTPSLLINHGLSGSGKSYGARTIVEKYSVIQIRSDVERKRLSRADNGGNFVREKDLYSLSATLRTYDRLADIAHCLLTAGYSVLIDATTLKARQRKKFIDLAGALNIPCCILNFKASPETLRERVRLRAEEGSDISDATVEVVESQIAGYEPLSADEKKITVDIDTEPGSDIEKILYHTPAFICECV
ncbi:MAG: AAA family ATPase [Deltaproteobacteria bacterium]|nr:AAA family ATPase [Deltaproteobacteria bacterium]